MKNNDQITDNQDSKIHEVSNVTSYSKQNCHWVKPRIVIYVREDGTVSDECFRVLETDEAIANFITKKKARFDSNGLESIIHLRGSDEENLSEVAERVIKIANDNGVNQVILVQYPNPKKNAEIQSSSDVTPQKSKEPEKD